MLDSATIVIMHFFLKMVELKSLHYIISLKSSIQAAQWMYLSRNDIELSWKLHLPEHLFQIFTYKYGIVVIF